MAEEKKVVTLDDFEQRLMVSGLMDFRNDLLRDEKPTEDINDLILKVMKIRSTPNSSKVTTSSLRDWSLSLSSFCLTVFLVRSSCLMEKLSPRFFFNSEMPSSTSSSCCCRMARCRSRDMGIFSNWLCPMMTAS